jgi:hypothetical protein
MKFSIDDFLLITIRGRFAYSVCCIENAVEALDKSSLDWREVFDFLWRYPTSSEMKDLALWHENDMESIPFGVLEDIPYEKKMCEYLTEEKHNKLKSIYSNCNPIICDLIDKTASVGTLSLYGGVRDGSPITLKYLRDIIEIMNKAKIPLPDLEFFKQFSYNSNPKTDWEVWGDTIPVNLLKQKSKRIDKVS